MPAQYSVGLHPNRLMVADTILPASLSIVEDLPARTFLWIDDALPAGPWPKALREQISVTMQNLGWTVVRSGEFGPLELLYRDFVSIFPRLMVDADDADRAAALYGVLHIMLWRRTQRLSELVTFNDDVVRPFTAYLSRYFPKSTPRPAVRETPRIAYLSETSDLFGANAVARITISLMLGQHALRTEDDRPILYCMNEPAPDLLAFATQHGLQVRNVARPTPMQTVGAVLAQLRADDIDLLIADNNSPVATMVMQRRPVPVQAFHDNGFAPWAISELDLALMGITKPAPNLFADHVVMAQTPRNTAYVFQKVARPAENITNVRAYLRAESGIADPSVVYGFYGRMAKVTADYMTVVETILKADPAAIFFAGGTGICTVIEDCKRHSPVGDRILIYNAFVDGHIVSECIDVFLDSFPFPGGMSCIEVQARGVPVVWLPADGGDEMTLVSAQRDPALKARDAESFVALASGLADPDLREAARSAALKIARRFGDMSGQAEQVEAHLCDAWTRARHMQAGLSS